MNKLTIDDVFENVKSIGEDAKNTIELSEELSRIINDVANARVKAGLSQRQLAEKCGIKQSAIARMESLQAIPRLDTLLKIAQSLGVKLVVESIPIQITEVVLDLDALKTTMQYSSRTLMGKYTSKANSLNFSGKGVAYGTAG